MTEPVDESKTVTLHGTVHPLARAQFDEGAVPDSFPAEHMLLLLNRPAERATALDRFLLEAHTQGSPGYHRWLTPEEYGRRFGPADSDIQTAVAWLTAQGFRVERVTKGRNLIEFSGTAGQVSKAFHTEIHQYRVKGEIHYAASSEQMIPEALAPLVRGVSPIHNFRAVPQARVIGPAWYSRSSGKATPLFTLTNSAYYAIAPEDFATQYDLKPLYSAGVNGSGQTIGIIGVSNIEIDLANAYRQLFGLSNNPPQVVIDGGDPGIAPLPNSDLEAFLDVELSGAVAPAATVNLYISNGSYVQDPLSLAALRAIEDDQAAVLSLSVAECESIMNSMGNTVWFGYWQQAAAQGQTVLVSAGDSGSAGCDEDYIGPAQMGLAVNGFASTPWNVAVGGTDFLYPNYSSGVSAAAPYWNQTNDANYGSLMAPIPEQPWDAALGLNITPGPNTIYATGGGASSCAQITVNGSGQITCLAGYAKPMWQAGPGVPNDGVRDLPDVSLFSGLENLSAYAICATEGECVVVAGSQPEVTLVGGTSASAPAMAGIMALVVQKYGRQGQADFTLYPLARQQPGAFHDVTTGTNNVPCAPGSPDCSLDTNGDGLYTLQEYPAGPGYDLASGLGSVDANALVMNWNSVSFQPTTTTLSLSGSSFVHGAPVMFTANVAPSSGMGTPTGNVALLTTSSLPSQAPSVFALNGGTAGASVYYLPGGTYQLIAQYEGDGIFGPSTSAAETVTISPEPSSILFTSIGPAGTLTNTGGQASYGQPWLFTAQPHGLSNQEPIGLATGTVTFVNGSSSLQAPINSQGLAADYPVPLAVGTNSVTLSYSGDASFEPATAGPFVFTITKADPPIRIPSVETSVPIGGSLLVSVVMGTGDGTPPTGSISVTLGSTTLNVPLTAASVGGSANATTVATFTNIQTPGSLSLTVNYAGDGNWNSASFTYPTPITVAASMRAASSTVLSVSATSINAYQSVTLSAMVYGSQSPPAPSGSVTFYLNGQALPAQLVATGPNSAAAFLLGALTAFNFSAGSNSITAVYSGDEIFNPSSSVPQIITVDQSELSLSLGVPRVAITSGQSGSVPLVLNGTGGFNAQVVLSCLPSSSSIGCNVNPSQPMVSGLTMSTLTVNAFIPGIAQNTSHSPSFPPLGPGAAIVTLVLLIFLRRQEAGRAPWARARVTALFGAVAVLILMAGCGGGSVTSTVPPPPPPIAASPGTYGVLVTATAKGVVHDIKLTVVVQ